MQHVRIIAFLVASTLAFSACDSSEPQIDDDPPDDPPGELVLADEVEVLEDGAEDEIESVAADGRTIVFERGSTAAERVEVGDIIIAAPSDAAPDGLLKRVEEVSQGNQVTVTVRDARMEEAVEEGTISADFTFSPDMIRGVPRMAPGARLVRGAKRGAASDVFTIELDEFVLYDDDTDLTTTTDQIRANGFISFTAGCSPRATFRFFRLVGFRFTCTQELDAELDVGWSRPFSWSGQTRVVPEPIVLSPLLIPGTPFWVTPRIDVYVGAEVDGEVGVATALTYNAAVEAGLEYENGTTEPIAELSQSAGYELDVTGRLAAEAYAGVPVSLLFLGLTGPYIEPQTYLALDADIDANPWWTLDWGLRADAGVETATLSAVVPDLVIRDVLDFRERLAEAEGPFGGDNPPGPFLVLPADGEPDARFGWSVAVSDDRAVVGAIDDDDNGRFSGSAYVFRRVGTAWVQEQKLLASDGEAGDKFGSSVAISDNRIVIGARGDDDNGMLSGSAYVFVLDGSGWLEEDKLVASDGGSDDKFGWSVGISGDDIVVGRFKDVGDVGAAYAFRRSGSSWIEEAILTPSDGASGDVFGLRVDVSDGIAIISSSGDDSNGSSSGSAYVFRRSGTSWVEEAKLSASDGMERDRFGRSVSISGDLVVVGAVGGVENETRFGSAYVFRRSGTSWVEEAKLGASSTSSNIDFGATVAVSGDVVIVGAPEDSNNGVSSGSAYVFRRSGTSWVEEAKLSASGVSANGEFGYTVGVSGDMAVVGAPEDDVNGTDSGSAYAFELDLP